MMKGMFRYYDIQLLQSCKRWVDDYPRFHRGLFICGSFRAI